MEGNGKDHPGLALPPAALTEPSLLWGARDQALLETAMHTPAQGGQSHTHIGTPPRPQASLEEPTLTRGALRVRGWLDSCSVQPKPAWLCPTEVKHVTTKQRIRGYTGLEPYKDSCHLEQKYSFEPDYHKSEA